MVYVSQLIQGKTHIYETQLTDSKDKVARRCNPSVVVDASNTSPITDQKLKEYVKNGSVCPNCLRYKSSIIIEEN